MLVGGLSAAPVSPVDLEELLLHIFHYTATKDLRAFWRVRKVWFSAVSTAIKKRNNESFEMALCYSSHPHGYKEEGSNTVLGIYMIDKNMVPLASPLPVYSASFEKLPLTERLSKAVNRSLKDSSSQHVQNRLKYATITFRCVDRLFQDNKLVYEFVPREIITPSEPSVFVETHIHAVALEPGKFLPGKTLITPLRHYGRFWQLTVADDSENIVYVTDDHGFVLQTRELREANNVRHLTNLRISDAFPSHDGRNMSVFSENVTKSLLHPPALLINLPPPLNDVLPQIRTWYLATAALQEWDQDSIRGLKNHLTVILGERFFFILRIPRMELTRMLARFRSLSLMKRSPGVDFGISKVRTELDMHVDRILELTVSGEFLCTLGYGGDPNNRMELCDFMTTNRPLDLMTSRIKLGRIVDRLLQ